MRQTHALMCLYDSERSNAGNDGKSKHVSNQPTPISADAYWTQQGPICLVA
jgi:hypothetical protein